AMRGFAQAACEFYRAAPWRHLDGEDLIQIESPFVDAALRYVSVLGGAGLSYGLGFYESPDEFHEIMGGGGADGYVSRDKCWMLFFDSIVELPFGDADLWQDHDFPVAQPEAYPLLMCASGPETFKRPGPDVLAFAEGLLRALAQTGEEQMDAGRWKQEVTTCEGDMTFELKLPDILEGEDADSPGRNRDKARLPDRRSMERNLADINRLIEEQDFDNVEDINAFLQTQLVDGRIPRQTPKTPLEEAQDIMYDAFDAVGRKQLQLIRKALAICPDCADAHVLLAERCSDLGEARAHYQRALESAERTLDPEMFEENVGRFWGITPTRPYMRARFGLAMTLDEAGRLAEAAEHYRELLRLNPNDNQGVRDFLLPVLIKLGANKEATQLLKRYKNDIMAVWNYSRALLTFREKGDTPTARKHLGKAIEANPYAPPLLLAEETIIETMDEYTPGSRQEAIYCARTLKEAWEMTEGALEWLDTHS
ncbi:MAG: tetratricopeptide repeat protein, partial [Planctomycetes bacterium]|nr:tetratricopeptide repeat protein [Planctomycetota bacterium]